MTEIFLHIYPDQSWLGAYLVKNIPVMKTIKTTFLETQHKKQKCNHCKVCLLVPHNTTVNDEELLYWD